MWAGEVTILCLISPVLAAHHSSGPVPEAVQRGYQRGV